MRKICTLIFVTILCKQATYAQYYSFPIGRQGADTFKCHHLSNTKNTGYAVKEDPDGGQSYCIPYFSQDSVDKAHDIIYIANCSFSADSSMWYFGDGDSSSSTTLTHTYKASGKYLLCLFITCSGHHYGFYCRYITDTGLVKSHGPQSTGFTLKIVAANPYSGIKDVETKALQIYPNPASHILNIIIPESVGQGLILVKNAVGQNVMSFPVTEAGLRSFDIASLPPALYLIQFLTPKGQYSSHLMKQ